MIDVFFSRQTLKDRNDQNWFRVAESEGDGIFQGCAPEAVDVLASDRGPVLRSKDGCVLAYIHVRFGVSLVGTNQHLPSWHAAMRHACPAKHFLIWIRPGRIKFTPVRIGGWLSARAHD